MFQRRLMSLRNICFQCKNASMKRHSIRFATNWGDLITGSEVLYSYKTEVAHDAMLVLRSAFNTIIKPRYCEDEPKSKEATVTIYGKPGNGDDVANLKKVIENVNSFRNITRYKSEGWPELVLVKFPYLQKYKKELQNCTALVVELPYDFNIFAQVFQHANLLIKDFENGKLWGYADLGDIELSKVKCIYADCYTGGDIVCHDYYQGSGTFKTMLGGSVYFKKMQGENFSVYSEEGNLRTDAVYCKDMVYCAEQGDVTAGNLHADCCFIESFVGNIKVDSLTSDETYARIRTSGNVNVILEKTSELHLESEKGDIDLKISSAVEADLLIHSRNATIASELAFEKLEKKSDPIKKFNVVQGKLGKDRKEIFLEANVGNVHVQKGDWMSSLRSKLTIRNP